MASQKNNRTMKEVAVNALALAPILEGMGLRVREVYK
jgi:hypothetical protein